MDVLTLSLTKMPYLLLEFEYLLSLFGEHAAGALDVDLHAGLLALEAAQLLVQVVDAVAVLAQLVVEIVHLRLVLAALLVESTARVF